MRNLTIPVVPEDEHSHWLISCNDVTEELQTCLVSPLEVVEDENDRLLLGYLREQSNNGAEEKVAL